MKRLIQTLLLGLAFFAALEKGHAQTPALDSAFALVAAQKTDADAVCITAQYVIETTDAHPQFTIPAGQRLLALARKKNSAVLEALALSTLAQGYRLIGNYVRALAIHNQAASLAQQTGNLDVLAYTNNQRGHVYKDREENDLALQCYRQAMAYSRQSQCPELRIWPQFNLAAVFLNAGRYDSALIYCQRAYELALPRDKQGQLSYIFLILGGVQSKLGNEALALSYLRMSLQSAARQRSFRYFYQSYMALAGHYKSKGSTDSAAFYARRAIAVLDGTPLYYLSSKPARMLADLYENGVCDSSRKYARFYKATTDSLTSVRVGQQIQLLTFEEEARALEADKARQHAEAERQQNIQYAVIALGISVLMMLYFILSRSVITNVKAIEYAGIFSLLLVFEFLNLVLHPYLEAVTHHSPILMLAALVAIASLLIPLHHKLEKWALATLVAKNKAIRLAHAKKTLEELEG